MSDLIEDFTKVKEDLNEKTNYIMRLNNEMGNVRKDRDSNKLKCQEAIKNEMAIKIRE